MKRTEALELARGPLAMTEENYRKEVAGEKWKTRRIAPYPELEFCDFNGRGNAVFTLDEKIYVEARPKYQPGEIYYLPEPVQIMEFWQHAGSCTVKYLWTDTCKKRWLTDDDTEKIIARKRGWDAPTTARFMRKSFAREFVRIKSVKVERLQDITPDDCRAEGMPAKNNDVGVRYAFGSLWNSIHGPDAWDANPWVWVYEFERLEVACG